MVRNEALRNEVTKVGFQLSLSRTQVEAIAWLEGVLQHGRHEGRAPRMWVAAMHRLCDKGLITHHWPPRNLVGTQPPYDHDAYGLGDCYTYTLAGTLVLGLLSESGLLQEEMQRLWGVPA